MVAADVVILRERNLQQEGRSAEQALQAVTASGRLVYALSNDNHGQQTGWSMVEFGLVIVAESHAGTYLHPEPLSAQRQTRPKA